MAKVFNIFISNSRLNKKFSLTMYPISLQIVRPNVEVEVYVKGGYWVQFSLTLQF